MKIEWHQLTLLLKHITGHKEQPNVQQQHIQPQNNHLTFSGRVFFRIALIRDIVALNSSGATRDTRPVGNSELKRLLSPNLQRRRNQIIYYYYLLLLLFYLFS